MDPSGLREHRHRRRGAATPSDVEEYPCWYFGSQRPEETSPKDLVPDYLRRFGLPSVPARVARAPRHQGGALTTITGLRTAKLGPGRGRGPVSLQWAGLRLGCRGPSGVREHRRRERGVALPPGYRRMFPPWPKRLGTGRQTGVWAADPPGRGVFPRRCGPGTGLQVLLDRLGRHASPAVQTGTWTPVPVRPVVSPSGGWPRRCHERCSGFAWLCGFRGKVRSSHQPPWRRWKYD